MLTYYTQALSVLVIKKRRRRRRKKGKIGPVRLKLK